MGKTLLTFLIDLTDNLIKEKTTNLASLRLVDLRTAAATNLFKMKVGASRWFLTNLLT